MLAGAALIPIVLVVVAGLAIVGIDCGALGAASASDSVRPLWPDDLGADASPSGRGLSLLPPIFAPSNGRPRRPFSLARRLRLADTGYRKISLRHGDPSHAARIHAAHAAPARQARGCRSTARRAGRYGDFFDRCDRWSRALQEMGVKKGDRVAYIAPNTHRTLESFYAVPQLGAVLVPLNYRLDRG